MITASSRWLSVIMVCLVAACHQAHPAERPSADRPSADREPRPELSGPNISAFSLRAAQRILTETEAPNDDVATLGGITRPLGLVYDPDAQDLIVFGQVGDGDPILLDDLVVMMRTVVDQGTWPLCSIDRTPETPFTGMQTVRFEGIENTSLGADCFVADTILKSLALGQMTAEDVDIPSYFDMLLDGIQDDGYRASVSSRLWGYPMQPSLIRRDNTFAIRDLKMGVQAETVPDPTGQADPLRDEIADIFAQQLTENYDVLSSEYPELGRMAGMFRLAALAYGMRSLQDSPDLRYWLADYDLPPVETETAYPQLRRAETLDMDDETLTVQVEGGIGMDEGTLRLEDGDLSVLREAVLKSRPDQGSLSWRISLRGAWLEDDAAADEAGGSTDGSGPGAGVDAGMYLTRRVAIVPRAAPGAPQAVWGNAQVSPDWRPVQSQQSSVRIEQAVPQLIPPQPQVAQPPFMQPPVQQVPRPYVPQPRVQRLPVPQPRVQPPPPPIPQPQSRAQQPQVAPQPQAQPQVQQPQVPQPQVRSAPAEQSSAPHNRGQQSQDQKPNKSDDHQSGGQHHR